MHTFGKVCLWFAVVVCIPTAMWFTAKVYTARAGYIKQKVDLEAKIEKNAAELTDLRLKTRTTLRELTHEKLRWAPYWNDVAVEVRQDNSVTIDIGSENGLNATVGEGEAGTQNLVHCFQPGENGQMEYVGDFRVTALEANRAMLAPNWTLQDGESDSWDASQQWRLRAMIPSSYFARFNGLELQLNSNDELLASKLEDLEEQLQLLKIAEERLAHRIAEIEGPQGDVAEADKRPREDVVGLLTTLEEYEEIRNAIIAKSDERRRILLRTLEDFERTQTENLHVVDSLPEGEKTSTDATEAAADPSTVSR
ncbi:hypothetical protein Mal52_47600 [Symmachiella dynata]|uniref:Uncharacterized protein n=1 Tax=Symmachiella dynata TaxID=2527995 RepID=A0A517ZUT0_9PLAN|nr:hypothetical protein [Symmachiella dynata]QDU46242.1 hypothetical protein Mal52_47600 [Symmachiella dynata]